MNTIKPYIRESKYYETDQMGIIHHSNYIRWFEEARMDFMEQMGFSYKKMEECGILSPVLQVSCEYHAAVRFGEQVSITCRLRSFQGIKMKISYEIRNLKTGELHTTGESTHCFVTKELKPLSLKKTMPEVYALFLEYVEKESM
jgi:acyl-CoA thioester hydrolase